MPLARQARSATPTRSSFLIAQLLVRAAAASMAGCGDQDAFARPCRCGPWRRWIGRFALGPIRCRPSRGSGLSYGHSMDVPAQLRAPQPGWPAPLEVFDLLEQAGASPSWVRSGGSPRPPWICVRPANAGGSLRNPPSVLGGKVGKLGGRRRPPHRDGVARVLFYYATCCLDAQVGAFEEPPPKRPQPTCS